MKFGHELAECVCNRLSEWFTKMVILERLLFISAVKRLIASKIKVFVYIIYLCVLCVFIMYT